MVNQRMRGAISGILTIAVTTLVFGIIILAVWSDISSLDDLIESVVRTAEAAFRNRTWHYLARATVLSFGIAVILTPLDILLARTPTERLGGLHELDVTNTAAALEEISRRISQCLTGSKKDIVSAFEELLFGAASLQASDVHISPTPSGVKLTYRVQGTLHEIMTLPAGFAMPLAARAKVLSGMDTHVRGKAQDGRLVTTLGAKPLEARASTLPTELGERIVLRLLKGGAEIPKVEDLGLSKEVTDGLIRILDRPEGILFVTGPVGSGKTTTLYSSLLRISDVRSGTANIVTLEDPIELELAFATQTQMNVRGGRTFAATLRSVLRQDPNVLMIGEIRDRETAEITVQAGLTGHLILTTVHAQNAAGPFMRLLEMDVEPFVLASATVGSVSQRLVRRLCSHCRRQVVPGTNQIDRFAEYGLALPAVTYFEEAGCDKCGGEGFDGRLPIAELMLIGPELRQAINDRKPTRDLYDIAVALGMTMMLKDGLARAARGETPLSEVLRVAG